jgi:hypothetical protein
VGEPVSSRALLSDVLVRSHQPGERTVTIAMKILCSVLCLGDDCSPSALNRFSERKYGNAMRIASRKTNVSSGVSVSAR